MVNKLLHGMIAIVIGLALLPVVTDFVDDLTGGTEPAIEGTMAALVDLVPILYVIVLISGVVGLVYTSTRN